MVLHPCAWCGRTPESGTWALEGGELIDARPGDVIVCLYCGRANIVSAELGLRRPTDEERDALEVLPMYRDAMRVARRFVAQSARWN